MLPDRARTTAAATALNASSRLAEDSMAERKTLADLVAGKLVLAALPSDPSIVGQLRNSGAKDVLVFSGDKAAGADNRPQRYDSHAEVRLEGIVDIAYSNCEVAILDKWSSLALNRKRYFWATRLQTLLVPTGSASSLYFAGLRYYQFSGRLKPAGTVEIATANGARTFAVVEIKRKKSAHNRHLFVPADWSSSRIFEQLSGLDYVLLRSVEAVEADDGYKDIDMLVSDADLPAMTERLRAQVATLPLDVYAEGGIAGHDYQSVPYFFPDMARKILASGEVRPSGIRVPSAKWQYLALAYHLIFHGKSRHLDPGARLDESTFDKPKHYHALVALAAAAGFPTPASFDDLDQVLRENGAFPGKDLIGFYARRNGFVAKRYLHRGRAKAGLAVFFVRDFGNGAGPVPAIADVLRKEYKVLAEGPVTDASRSVILERIRGGNWRDMPGTTFGEPVYWFVCWDEAPRTPKGKMRRKYPHLDNEKTALIKLAMREALGGSGRANRIVHASDNSDEALEHLSVLGLASDARVVELLGTAPDRASLPAG